MTLYSSHASSLHKASILFRGDALGVTWQTQKKEKYTERFTDFFDQLKILLAGKAAEEIKFGKEKVSTGCLSDLQKATQMARHLVTSFGVGLEDSSNNSSSSSSSSSSGTWSLGGASSVCLDAVETHLLSETIKEKIEAATQQLLAAAFEEAKAVLKEKQQELERVAQALLKYETLTADEIRAAAAGTLDLSSSSKQQPLQQQQQQQRGRQQQQKQEKQQPAVASVSLSSSNSSSSSSSISAETGPVADQGDNKETS
ncbi:atp-dependent metalloprotease ftsh, putative [Eimeria tenella]|uniref:Atp-dependent metalloprotease ftsh, putative n=1 Tax=Eimeria tenella TaxID=5802 RepID=C8TDS3_EIMTE|nr:atp-dependent metalloprotease ftsh, putative [Eimeria tenella]